MAGYIAHRVAVGEVYLKQLPEHCSMATTFSAEPCGTHFDAAPIFRSRTWPTPSRPWGVRMIWHDLLFAHWPVDADDLRAKLPPGLTLDTFAGEAWLGVVPFRMTGIRARCLPPIPGLSAMPELNVRTYVVADGKPGVLFLTLDTVRRLAVRAARRIYHLPYCDARIDCKATADGWIEYRSCRCDRLYPPAEFAARYRPSESDTDFATDRLANWLTARYCLYVADRRGRLWRGEIDHSPWPLQAAEAEVEAAGLVAGLGIRLPDVPPLLHFSRRIEAVAWTLDLVE